MGILVKNKAELISLGENLYLGFSVGLCGCLTTFSSWQTDALCQFFKNS
jgi:fluoride ion exporter CrcB/FEX